MGASGEMNSEKRVANVWNRVDVSAYHVYFVLFQLLIDAFEGNHTEIQA
jgi:hypothetical protein